ncbi:MAG TPA: hypothetical protein VNC62_01565 [Burkholderiales bacterium]|nr:hypothetical protein [Burkholderiales bacterium]
MKPEIADKLSDATDFYQLTKAVLSLCEPYGPVHAFRMVHNRGSARVACLVEMESPKQQQALARALGGRVLNGAACLEIPVEKDFGGAREVAILPPRAFEAAFKASASA